MPTFRCSCVVVRRPRLRRGAAAAQGYGATGGYQPKEMGAATLPISSVPACRAPPISRPPSITRRQASSSSQIEVSSSAIPRAVRKPCPRQSDPGVQAIVNFAGGAARTQSAAASSLCSTPELVRAAAAMVPRPRNTDAWIYAGNDKIGPLPRNRWPDLCPTGWLQSTCNSSLRSATGTTLLPT